MHTAKRGMPLVAAGLLALGGCAMLQSDADKGMSFFVTSAGPGNGGDPHRNWECNECYGRRQRELTAFQKTGGLRKGDSVERETLASPPPPQGKI